MCLGVSVASFEVALNPLQFFMFDNHLKLVTIQTHSESNQTKWFWAGKHIIYTLPLYDISRAIWVLLRKKTYLENQSYLNNGAMILKYFNVSQTDVAVSWILLLSLLMSYYLLFRYTSNNMGRICETLWEIALDIPSNLQEEIESLFEKNYNHLYFEIWSVTIHLGVKINSLEYTFLNTGDWRG